jgi:hypothetical protein
MKLGERTSRAMKPDAQAFDEVRIITVPRYKTSGLSGDEWRISARIEFLRKGKKVHESVYRNIEMACTFLVSEYHRAIDDGKAYFAGEGDICDQEGCAEPATVTYRVLAEFCRDHPHEHKRELTDTVVVRKFCARHSRRGDASFDDADSNYRLIEGSIENPLAVDVRQASQVEVRLNSLDELPEAMKDVRKQFKH